MNKKLNKSSWPRIRVRGESWMVDAGKVFGKRRRASFKTKAEADRCADDWRAERKTHQALKGHERRNRSVSLAKLTDTQRAEVLQAYDLLGAPRGLLEAVRFFKDHSAPATGGEKLETVYEAYLEAKTKANKRPRTIRDIRSKLHSFVYDNADRPVHLITTADIEAFMDQRGYGGNTRNAYRRAFLGLFNFAIKRGYAEKNPASVIERSERDEGSIFIHSTSQVGIILQAAERHHPVLVPYLAIGYFAGLRPENELAGLDWENVDLAGGHIRVDPATAKKRRQRYVDITDNLAIWLAYHKKSRGRIYYSRALLKKVRELAGVQWGRDVMRHTFASNHFALYEDAGKTAAQLGHSGSFDLLFNHYRHLVKRKDAEAFWKIRPATSGRLLKLGAA